MFTPKNRGNVGVYLLIAVAAFVLGSLVMSNRPAHISTPDTAIVNDAGSENLGGVSKTDSNVTVERLTTGGQYYSTTTGATATLRKADIANNGVISIVAGQVAGVTVTLPATSTLADFIPRTGDISTLYVQNNSTGATSTTFAAGTGMTIDNATSTLIVAPGSTASITLIRQPSTDVKVMFNIFQ